ncbi:UDP-glucose/GDP-mannose dehydrogenase family protein [Anaerobacillus alkaliphilus]|uniref:UDP-glucose 6-dehydrogenase n=1 Tax=Anaerobacillus alkaliphilus TaxID=1548597 RepID=A0A4Q0VN39_9BACI|nr:UDP-glucose/GDP-mannose dehydrogenase family protein [Anaerobacillus alkaliphilus]RXI96464.1 UDP-glucose/GDP-mannose dehydrogenase family protein [Anaerobacillus alkaliphilus]
MKVLVIGMGYVGTTLSLVLANEGHQVTGVDIDKQKIECLKNKHLYFYEPGLEQLLDKHLDNHSISFSTDVQTGIRDNEVIFVCVGTPQSEDGSPDLRYITATANEIGQSMNGYKLIIIKSTVPVGTNEMVSQWVEEAQVTPYPFDVVSNPEFLREGSALYDSLHPDRIVIGSTNENALQLVKSIFKDLHCPIVETTPRTAELIKYVSNSFLATKISFMNEIAKLCDSLGTNVNDIARGVGLDHRIGSHFLEAGIGYGGSCFPKDIKALLKTGAEQKVPLSILQSVENVNEQQYMYLMEKMLNRLGSLTNKSIAVFGLSFKPNTDDVREAPAFFIINYLLSKGVKINIHDPIVQLERFYSGYDIEQFDTAELAAAGTDAVILCTDWPHYMGVDWKSIQTTMNTPNLYDGRNMLNSKQMTDLGFYYEGVGYK